MKRRPSMLASFRLLRLRRDQLRRELLASVRQDLARIRALLARMGIGVHRGDV